MNRKQLRPVSRSRLAVLVWLTVLSTVLALQALGTICVRLERLEVRRVVGLVVDSEELLLPGVKLTLSRVGGGYEKTVYTDDEGFFAFQTAPDGDYVLKASFEGFLPGEARVRVRSGSERSEVLLMSLPIFIGDCVTTEMISARQARRLQGKR